MARLLIFTLSPEAEQRRRRLLPSAYADLERRLHRHGLEQAVDAGLELGWDVSVCSPRPLSLPPTVTQREQTRGSFGERLRHVVANEESEASASLVIVGSDCPGLGPRHLTRAASALADDPSRVVIGPSPDGGFYLLAAAQPVSSLLASVLWRSRSTRASLVAACRAAGRPVVFLEPLADLDRPRDLERMVATGSRLSSAWHWLTAGLARILAACRAPRILPLLGRRLAAAARDRSGRAPPPPFRF